MAPTVSPKRSFQERSRWLCSALLTASAVIGGPALVSPVCYWQGRLISRGDPFTPSAWDPNAEPTHWFLLCIGIAWAGLWAWFAFAQLRRPLGWLAVAVPLVAFVWWALEASRMSYACNPF